MPRRITRTRAGATVILSAAFVLSVVGTAAAAPAGPAPMLVGTWQAQAPNNNYVINVVWNPATVRYEGTLVRQGYWSARSGLMLGEVCWVASPAGNQPYLQGAEEIAGTLPGRPPGARWRQGFVRLDPRNPNLMFSGAARFLRVGAAAAPAPPVAPVPRPEASPPAAERPGENPAVEDARAAAEKQLAMVAERDARNPPVTAGNEANNGARDNPAAPDDEATVEGLRRAKADVERAKKARVDLTLLGVPMGERLNVPNCAAYGIKPGQGAMFRRLDGMAGTFMAADPTMQKIDAWKDKTPVCVYQGDNGASLEWMRAPSWVNTTQVTMRGQVLLGGTFTVSEVDDLFEQLASKYHKPTIAEKQQFHTGLGIKNERTQLEWILPGLYVRYTPLSGNINLPTGELQIELESLHRLHQKEKAEKEAKAPRL